MEPLLTLDDLMQEPDLLSTAINSISPEGSLTQQQKPKVQIYYYHPQQPQQTQPQVSQLKEINDLKKRVQQLEDQRPQRKTDPLELNPIRIPLTIEIATTESSMTIPNKNRLGPHSKHIDNPKRKRKQ